MSVSALWVFLTVSCVFDIFDHTQLLFKKINLCDILEQLLDVPVKNAFNKLSLKCIKFYAPICRLPDPP